MAVAQHHRITEESCDDHVEEVTSERRVQRRVAMAVVTGASVAAILALSHNHQASLRRVEPASSQVKPTVPPPGLSVPEHSSDKEWRGFKDEGNKPCVGFEGKGQPQPTNARCAQSCADSPTCNFVSYCPKYDESSWDLNPACTLSDSGNCVHFEKCEARESYLAGTYKTYSKLASWPKETPTFPPDPWTAWNFGYAPGKFIDGGRCAAPEVSSKFVKSEGRCAHSCLVNPACNFVAHCTDADCKDERYKCVQFASCDFKDQSNYNVYDKYLTYRKVTN